ncbi:Choline-sulfatase [Microbacterium sp. TNHR37B]|nr:Choline-sulfatase [Microbacterium sp. TNHR37B]
MSTGVPGERGMGNGEPRRSASGRFDRLRRWGLRTLALAAAGLAVVGGGIVASPTADAVETQPRNVVMIMADDFSWDLVPYMTELKKLTADGVSFDNHYVTNSLCCPSRASILTGRFPHNTGVLRNGGTMGGIEAFLHGVSHSGEVRDNEQYTYAVEAKARGYYTLMEGKYLNGYNNDFGVGDTVRKPPGWSMWRPYSSGAYGGNNFAIGTPGQPAKKNKTYATDETINRVAAFIPWAAKNDRAFHATLSTFTTHAGNPNGGKTRTFVPAARDLPKTKDNPKGAYKNGDCGITASGARRDCYSIRIESLPGNETMNCPTARDRTELPSAKPIGKDDACELQQYLRDRVRMAQSLDELIGKTRRELTKAGLWESTYLVFTADNGFHLGQGVDLGLSENGSGRFRIGKGSPYETDLRVPLVVAGADAARGQVRTELTQTVDLLPTFAAMQPSLTGESAQIDDHDGLDLLPLIRGEQPQSWRQWAYSVHTKVADPTAAGPDSEPGTMVQDGFFALRAGGELYVQKVSGPDRGTISRFSITDTKNGRVNLPLAWEDVDPARRAQIEEQFRTFARCGGGEAVGTASCQAAARTPLS